MTPTGRSTFFAVDNVTPAGRLIWSQPLSEALPHRLNRRVLRMPDAARPVVNPYVDSLSPEQRERFGTDLVSRTNPLVDAVHGAFSQHHPLTLTPDCIWLTIAQGFSHHITQDAEAFRGRLVAHEGKKQLMADAGLLSEAGCERAIASFSQQIRDASDPVVHETLICDFSTTTPVIRTASEVVLMDTYSDYFEYEMGCVCGIPFVKLLGTAEDWQRIRARVEVLATFGLEWWVRRLRPILDQFVLTALGAPDLEFWQAIYKPRYAYAVCAVTGWLADLFPYLGDPPNRYKSHVFKHRRKRWAVAANEAPEPTGWARFNDPEARKGVSTNAFPSGLSKVPVRIQPLGGPAFSLELIAGLFAIEQDPADLSVCPVIGWCLAEEAKGASA